MAALRSPLFSPAVLLLGIAAMFTFDGNGISSFWADQPQGALVLLAVSMGLWVLVLRTVRKVRNVKD
ncbi:hypothetical protein JF66_07480 [Cryobacterium sp. MLB-32]|uniref:hypothetical protein n=1 Tax=Cryobacterium sp. MLB-32 TaxID=1529318 RepID=UPI0004E67EE8|nr:hypothetical protein [Cryobacterium sp. MLB-32]KFF59984.1 hypothetical protein JF66_07480 [Cryobacterium sp. MLB-32]